MSPIRPKRASASAGKSIRCATLTTPIPIVGRDGARPSVSWRGYDHRPIAVLAQLLPQQLVDQRRVGLALGRFHHLADEEAEHLGVRGVLRDLGRAGGERGVDRGLDRAGVGDLAQALGLDDCRRRRRRSRPSRRRRPWRCGRRSCRRRSGRSAPPSWAAATGESSMPSPCLFSAPNRSPITQFAAALGSRPSADLSRKTPRSRARRPAPPHRQATAHSR